MEIKIKIPGKAKGFSINPLIFNDFQNLLRLIYLNAGTKTKRLELGQKTGNTVCDT